MYDELPSWLQIGFVENNKLALRLKNGSQALKQYRPQEMLVDQKPSLC
jgi:hypothetical protein